MEKRRHRRYSKRFKVNFGEKAFTHTGFSGDVSATGMFIVTAQAAKVGSRQHLQIMLDGDRCVYAEGVVARLALVAPELRQIMKGGFGVRYLSGVEMMAEMVPHLKDKTRIELIYPTQEEFAKAFETELKRGGVFAWTEKQHAIDTIINVEVEAPFVKRTLSFEARVIHVVPGPDGRHGTALMFIDANGAITGLSSLLGK